jgi:hypothetical protein
MSHFKLNLGQSKETPILMATPAAKKIVATPTTPHIGKYE